MALLLDTHAFLWFLNDDARLSPLAAERIGDPGQRIVVSVVSAWEIAIKTGTGKLILDRPLQQLWVESLTSNEFQSLDIMTEHVLAVGDLPPHHRDPFDRLLIAQSRIEHLDLVSADAAFDAYGITRVW